MKKIVFFLLSALFCTTGNFTTAQSLSEKVIKNYPTSVVLRVYDAMLVRAFDEAQQIKLADEYQKQEQALELLIQKRDSTQQILQWLARNQKKISAVSTPEEYLQEMLEKMNRIKPLSAELRQKITQAFTTAVIESPQKRNEDLFEYAISKSTTEKIYYNKLFYDKIKAAAETMYANAMKDLTRKKLPKDCYEELAKILIKRSWEHALCDMVYKSNNIRKTVERKKINEKYEDPVARIVIRNNSQAYTTYFRLALNQRKALHLTDAQVDSIVEYSIRFKNMRRVNSTLSGWEYEQKKLLKILDESQFDSFLTMKNIIPSAQYAVECWKEIKKNGLQADLDSARIVRQITHYRLNQSKINDRYPNDPFKRQDLNRDLNRSMPKILWELKLAREAPENRTDLSDKRYRGAFSW